MICDKLYDRGIFGPGLNTCEHEKDHEGFCGPGKDDEEALALYRAKLASLNQSKK